jgi:hypothetical protein
MRLCILHEFGIGCRVLTFLTIVIHDGDLCCRGWANGDHWAAEQLNIANDGRFTCNIVIRMIETEWSDLSVMENLNRLTQRTRAIDSKKCPIWLCVCEYGRVRTQQYTSWWNGKVNYHKIMTNSHSQCITQPIYSSKLIMVCMLSMYGLLTLLWSSVVATEVRILIHQNFKVL